MEEVRAEHMAVLEAADGLELTIIRGCADSRETLAHSVAPKVVGNSTQTSGNEAPEGKPDRRRRRRRRQDRMTERQRRLCLILSVVSLFDLIISGSMACIAFTHAYLDNGVSLYCLGIQSVSHGLSSCLLALRFLDELRVVEDCPAGPEEGLLRRRRRVYLVREKYMSYVMGLVLYISSAACLFKAVRKAYYWEVWYLDHVDMDRDASFATVFLSWYGACVYAFQAAVRAFVGAAMRRAVIRDSVAASVVSLIFLAVLGLAATFEREWSWKAEPIAAMLLASCTIGEGTRLFYTHHGDVERRLDSEFYA